MCGLLDVAAARRARRVDVDGDQRFGVVDHHGAARGQVDGARERGLDLVPGLEAAEQCRVVAVALNAVAMFRHHIVHELMCLLVNVVGIDENLTNVAVEVVANSTNNQAGFLVNEERTFAITGCPVYSRPQLKQVVQVPLKLFRCAPDAGSARNDAHAIGVFQLV